jgi:fructose-6-phosphate aldolase 2
MLDKDIAGVQLAAASIRTAHQVEQSALAGAQIAAVGLGILEACANHPLTNQCVGQFIADWEQLYGAGKRVYNL